MTDIRCRPGIPGIKPLWDVLPWLSVRPWLAGQTGCLQIGKDDQSHLRERNPVPLRGHL